MKFTIKSKSLLSVLTASGKTISNKPAISILSNFLFVLDGNTLTITAADSETVVTSRIAVEDAEGVGSVCIDARRITELLKAMPDCPIVFNINPDNYSVVVRYTNGKYNLTGLSGAEYPLSDEINPDDIVGSFVIPSSQIINAFDKVGFAVSDDDFRPMMKGIYWDITKDAVNFVATDTRVLVKYRSTQTATGCEMNFILPGMVVPTVRAFIGKQADVKVIATDRAIVFQGDTFTIRAPKLQGRYPDYNRVIPSADTHTQLATIDRNDLLNAITRVAVCADTTHSLLRLKFASGTLKITAQDINFNVGGEESIACEFNNGDLEIGFNSINLKAVLNSIATQNVFIRMRDAACAALFLPSENDEHSEQFVVLMPMSIKAS